MTPAGCACGSAIRSVACRDVSGQQRHDSTTYCAVRLRAADQDVRRERRGIPDAVTTKVEGRNHAVPIDIVDSVRGLREDKNLRRGDGL